MAKRVIDYAFKSYVLKEHNDLLQKAKKSSLLDYAISQYECDGVLMPILRRSDDDLMTTSSLYSFCLENGLKTEFFECLKINQASYKRTKRLKDRIESMLLNGECLFLTLTFNDSALSTTTPKQRRVAVSRYLKLFNSKYVANIDFGSKNNREHYHAIINTSNIDLRAWREYGNINVERIRNTCIESDKTRLAKYIAKLSNHCIKETTKRSSLLYSR